ncbi:hypothetical protein D5b_00454 [Faustovirus]|nr:hypothetical protein D5b_00454 [Faustovirus]AMN84465.1 hypothetical protein D6_00054 [Faustovirus]
MFTISNIARNVFDHASRKATLPTKASNLIFDSFINGDIPAFHDDNKAFDKIILVVVAPFENGVLGTKDGGKFVPIHESAVAGFDFGYHGGNLAHLLKDDVDFVAAFLARLFVRLSNNTVSFTKTYNEIKALNDEDDGLNTDRLILNTTLAQRDNTVYYFTRCSMRLYDWLLTINDETTQIKGIDETVASKLMWLDRGVLFKDLYRGDRDHYLWLNSAFKWFTSKLVCPFRGAAPEVEKLNEFSKAIYINSREASGAKCVQEQMLKGPQMTKYLHRCIEFVNTMLCVYQNNPENRQITANALQYHNSMMQNYYSCVDSLNLKLKNNWISFEQFEQNLRAIRAQFSESINYTVAFEACRLMVSFYNYRISQLGYEKILNDVFADN